MNIISITVDSVCILFLLVILVGVLGNPQSRDLSTKYFVRILIITLLGLVTDILAYVLEGYDVSSSVKYFTTMLPYALTLALLLVFSLYCISIISKRTQISYRAILPICVLVAVDFLFLVVSTFLGKFFYIENGTRIRAVIRYEFLFLVISTLGLGYLFWLLLRFRSSLDRTTFIALDSYIVFPLVSYLFSKIMNDLYFTFLQYSMTCLINYILIQSRAIMEADIRTKVLQEASMIDSLTGLMNRRSYDEMLKQEPKGFVGVVFSDLNRLKYTNDTFGHEAGDQLLIGFADILRESFPTGEIFRISGDEFVVILKDISQQQMEDLLHSFRERILQNNWIASVGSVYGQNEEILEQVRSAEKQMYKDKAMYYKKTGRDRRK